MPATYSYPATALLFALGGLVTAVFSGSLFGLASGPTVSEVLAVGMIVPSFTWLVQLTASAVGMSAPARRVYWGELARVCLLGSFALIPAAAVNLLAREPPLWLSQFDVLASVAIMGTVLARRSTANGISWRWPASWCLTIAANMALFYWVSRPWWPAG